MDDASAEQRLRFGRLITELQGDMSTVDLAKAVGLSRNQLYLLKDGQSGTSPQTVRRFVQVFALRDRDVIERLYALAGFAMPEEDERSGTDPDLVDLGRRLRQRRDEMRYTLADMGLMLGISGEGYGYYERGERPISVTNLRKVAKILKTSVAALLGETKPGEADEDEILALYYATPPELRPAGRAALKGIAELAERTASANHAKNDVNHVNHQSGGPASN